MAAITGADLPDGPGRIRALDWVRRTGRGGDLWYRRSDGTLYKQQPAQLTDGTVPVAHLTGPATAPLKVYLDFTNRCNLSCRHCISSSGPDADTSTELPTDRIIELIEELAEQGVLEIAMAGGEPFLHPDWEVIFSRVTECGMNLLVTTNGLLLSDHALDVLVELDPLEVRVSFDGGPGLHEHVRGRHTYLRSMRTVARMAAAGLRVSGRLTLCAGGDDELPVLFDDLRNAGVKTIKVAVAKAAGRGAGERGRHLVRQLPDPSAAAMLHRFAKDAGLRLRLAADDFPTDLRDGELSKLRDVDRPNCGAGTETAYVTPQGELLGCVAIPDISFGALHTESFTDVWEGRVARHYRDAADASEARRLCDVLTRSSTDVGPVDVPFPSRRRAVRPPSEATAGWYQPATDGAQRSR